MSETLESRKIYDLKVPELRSELEKRDLDKTGVKAILLERLQKVSVSYNDFVISVLIFLCRNLVRLLILRILITFNRFVIYEDSNKF